MPTDPSSQAAARRSALSATQVITALAKLQGWKLHGDGASVAIEKTFEFTSFLQTMAFANAVAFIAEQQDHHPEMVLNYRQCSLRYRTHSAHGITQADFAAATAVDALQTSAGSA